MLKIQVSMVSIGMTCDVFGPKQASAYANKQQRRRRKEEGGESRLNTRGVSGAKQKRTSTSRRFWDKAWSPYGQAWMKPESRLEAMGCSDGYSEGCGRDRLRGRCDTDSLFVERYPTSWTKPCLIRTLDSGNAARLPLRFAWWLQCHLNSKKK